MSHHHCTTSARPHHGTDRYLRIVRLAVGIALLAGVVAAETATYSYDDNGRLVSVTYGGGNTVSYVYDAATNTVRETTSSAANTLQVWLSPADAGSVSGTGIACPPDCSEAFTGSPTVTLTTAPAAGFVFLHWTEDLTGAPNPATVTMAGDRMATAYLGASGGHTDLDGLADQIEMGPNGDQPGFDGNRDGLPDYQQDNVASLPTADGTDYATLAVADGLRLVDVTAVADPSADRSPPPGVSFPFGFFAFTVSGLDPEACTTVDLFLPPARLTSYYKYGPTVTDPDPHWYEFVHYHPALPGAETLPVAEGSLVRLFLCDAQLGDNVLTADGLIADPGGPAGVEILAAGIDVSPLNVSFGTVEVGASANSVVTVTASGAADLMLGTVGAGDPLAAPFEITADDCSGATLASGSSCQLSVRFEPAAAGEATDSFAIPSNAADQPVVTVAVRGTGEAQQIQAIPTLSGLGLALLILGLAACGVAILWCRLR